ncbi:MAG: PhzF family phenazine biosynthesis protein [Sutterella sp.]|nr:PhzF family phenazine biosynthesis protein [Sutterella sp.]
MHVTAPSRTYDYVARSFAPKLAIDEDPVCGSGHCHLIPYWAKRLGKTDLFSLQASERSGELYCEDRGARVTLKGQVALFSEGTIHVPLGWPPYLTQSAAVSRGALAIVGKNPAINEFSSGCSRFPTPR